jgi:hypothetical protein
LRVQPYHTFHVYYRDTSALRKLPCPAAGHLMVDAQLLMRQFGELLSSVTLPSTWRDAIAERCRGSGEPRDLERPKKRRAELEAEQQRLVVAFTKGYLPELDLDERVNQIRLELQRLPNPETKQDVGTQIAELISAGETLADMAGYWEVATAEERRDMVWALLPAEGLIYDLERRMIAAILPRPAVLPVLALGLEGVWERRDDEGSEGLWRTGLDGLPRRAYVKNVPPQTPPALTPEQREQALTLARSGLSLRKIAAYFPGVSYGAIWRLLQAERQQDE